MKEFLLIVLKWIDHNRWLVGALVIVVGMTITSFGCQPKTDDPFNPGQKVGRAELGARAAAFLVEVQAEQAFLEAKVEAMKPALGAAYDELERQETMIQTAIDAIGGLATTAAGPYAPLVTTGLGILALGFGVDNRRKDRVILEKKTEIALARTVTPTV